VSSSDIGVLAGRVLWIVLCLGMVAFCVRRFRVSKSALAVVGALFFSLGALSGIARFLRSPMAGTSHSGSGAPQPVSEAAGSDFAAFKRSTDEGKAFAARGDSEACTVEATARVSKCADLMSACYMETGIFFSQCLRDARRSPEFCQGVPKLASTLSDVDVEHGWRAKRCEKLGHPGEKCEQLLTQQQAACDEG
jgi:hypothetical protein